MSPDEGLERQRLEAEAALLRSRLSTTLEALDQRWNDAKSGKLEARRQPLPVALLGAGALCLAAGGTGLTLYRAQKARRRLLPDRAAALARILKHPDRLAAPDRLPLSLEIARRVIAGLATYVVIRLTQNSLAQLASKLRQKTQTA